MEGIITDIQLQSRNRDRVNVYLDGEFAFGLAGAVAKELKVGQRLTAEAVEDLKEGDTVEKAYKQALRLVAHRARSEHELRLRFRKRGFDERIQERVIQRLRGEGWVDDLSFAKAWIENRMAFRPRGRLALQAELRKKGIDNRLIDQALEGFDQGAALRKAAKKGARKYAKLSQEEFIQKLRGYLARRGFPYSKISPVVERLWENLSSPAGESEGER